MVIIEKVDYNKFRLFLLSLLWRMSISSDKLFREVRLGPHEEEIRRILRSEVAPKDPLIYPVILTGVLLNDKIPTDLITQAEHHRINTLNSYRILIGGVGFAFIVSKQSKTIKFPEMIFDLTGRLQIKKLQGEDMGFVTSFIKAAQPIVKRLPNLFD